MKIIFFVVFFYGMVTGSMMDDYYTYKAQQYYEKGDLKNSFEYYEKIEQKSDLIYYNMANILYQNKNYKEAILLYEKIISQQLFEKKWYNLANSYVKTQEFKKAVYYYKKVLAISDDIEAQENLLVVEKYLQEEKRKELKKQEDLLKAKRYGKEYEDMFEDSELVSTNLKEGENSNIQNKENISNLLSINEKEQIYFKELPSKLVLKTLENSSEEKFTLNQEKKWDTLLKEKKMDSLIIPLNKKGVLDENVKYPW